MTIRYVRTLDYYDLPQVFEARDSIGGHYVAVLGAIEESQYLVAGVAPERLRAVCDGKAELRHLITESDVASRYVTTTVPSLEGDELEVRRFNGVLEDFLPDPGYVLDEMPSADLHVGESLRLELKLDALAGKIDIGLYTELIHHVRMLAKHTLGEVREGTENWRWRDGIFDVVVPAATGSFRLILEASARQNPGFRAKMAEALRRIDTLFEHSDDPRMTLAAAMENRGEIAMTYLKLLQLLDRNETGLRYSWAEGRLRDVRSRSVSSDQAKALAEVLIEAPPTYEAVEREGELYKCHKDSGHWGMWVEGERVTGWVRRGGPDLGGLRLGARYRFRCRAMHTLERARPILHLANYQRVGRPGVRGT